MKKELKFGLILCTVDRDFSYLDNFVKSLLRNTYENWELIIVDQNTEDTLYTRFIQKYENLVLSGRVKYLRVNFRGLSRARNYGMQFLSDEVDIVTFPDNACEYPCNLLETVANLFERYELDIVTGRSFDKELLVDSVGKHLKKNTPIKISNVFMAGISITIFVKKKPV